MVDELLVWAVAALGAVMVEHLNISPHVLLVALMALAGAVWVYRKKRAGAAGWLLVGPVVGIAVVTVWIVWFALWAPSASLSVADGELLMPAGETQRFHPEIHVSEHRRESHEDTTLDVHFPRGLDVRPLQSPCWQIDAGATVETGAHLSGTFGTIHPGQFINPCGAIEIRGEAVGDYPVSFTVFSLNHEPISGSFTLTVSAKR